MDQATRRPRNFAFVEFGKLSEAEACQKSLNGRSLADGSAVTVVFVEDKKDEDRGGRGNLSRLPQPAPIAPAPPLNPMTETYRYNVMAGEFVIDSTGRLTRRRGETDEVRETENEETISGIGGGLLKAVRAEGDVAMRLEEDDQDELNEDMWSLNLRPGRYGLLHPQTVVDYKDI